MRSIRFHPWAWTAWTAACLAILVSTRNPWYLALILLCIALVKVVTGLEHENTALPLSPLRFGLIVVLLAAIYNSLNVHIGTHVLAWLPGWLPLLGGPITLEALCYGALNGLSLAGLFTLFAVLNQALPVRSLISLIPRAFYPIAIVTSIAITYLPTTLYQFRHIREAQAIRGHRVRRLRDWLPLFMPLLVGGLERALQLAEAMMARGFASRADQTHTRLTRLLVVLGLLVLLVGWLLRLGWHLEPIGLLLMCLGGGLVLVALRVIGSRVARSTYRQETWHIGDTAVVLGALVATSVFLVGLPGLDRSSIFYYPYPSLVLPRFDVVIGVACLGLLMPAGFQLGALRQAKETRLTGYMYQHLIDENGTHDSI